MIVFSVISRILENKVVDSEHFTTENLGIITPKVDLEWEEIDSPLDANNHRDTPEGAEGLRMFPGKKTPNDTTARNTVKLKAHVTPAIAGQKVFFKVFDVDDPSTDTTIDSNGTEGDDNRGTPKTGALVLENEGITDENGDATAIFTTTMNPGDNFRAIATVINDTTGDYDNAEVLALDPNEDSVTQTLTIWRVLHIEQDTWRKPTIAELTFSSATPVSSVIPNTPIAGRSTINLGVNLPDDFDDENMFEEGSITFSALPAGSNTFRIVSNTANTFPFDDEIVIEGTVTQSPLLSPYVLRDDDDANVLPHFPSPGVMGANAFADAYIDLFIMGPEYRDTIDYFNLNMNLTEIRLGLGTSGKDLTSTSTFWVHYVVGVFQGPRNMDFDTDGHYHSPSGLQDEFYTPEGPLLGITRSNKIAYIFLETLRDRMTDPGRDEAHLVTHEIGHGVGGNEMHNDGGIMTEGAPDQFNDFTPATIIRMRKATTYGDIP